MSRVQVYSPPWTTASTALTSGRKHNHISLTRFHPMMETDPRSMVIPRDDSSSTELGRIPNNQVPTATQVMGTTPNNQNMTDHCHHHETDPPNTHLHQNALVRIHPHLIPTILLITKVHQTPARVDGGDHTTTTGPPLMILSKPTSSWKKQNRCFPISQHIQDTTDLREFGSSPWLMLTCTPITNPAIA